MQNQDNSSPIDWREIFDSSRPEQRWMPSQISHEEQSEIRFFGYKYFSDGKIHEVTDWEHIKSFIASEIAAAIARTRSEDIRIAEEMELAECSDFHKENGMASTPCGLCGLRRNEEPKKDPRYNQALSDYVARLQAEQKAT